ncbi:MAG: CRISPR-associated endonuclease Cas2 [Candidatus Curtissbacteria bacterium]|nr:CRISPR-associated endonuclease Cas2 [Candidatus Curtissbacteria bacterium]
MIKKGTTTYHLLLMLEKAMETGVPFVDFIDNPSKFAWTGYRSNLNYNSTYKTIKRLKDKGYLLTKREERKIIVELTQDGRNYISLAKLLEDSPWDGKWRIVIFDVPEDHRKLRNALRYRLKEWQFQQLQKSVWISKKDIVKELKSFIKEVGVENWVKIFVASEEKLT